MNNDPDEIKTEEIEPPMSPALREAISTLVRRALDREDRCIYPYELDALIEKFPEVTVFNLSEVCELNFGVTPTAELLKRAANENQPEQSSTEPKTDPGSGLTDG